MLDTRYPFLSAYFKGEEARLVTSDHIDRISKVSSIRDVFGIIKETDIGGYLDGELIETFDSLDEHLWRYLSECLQRIEWFKPVPADILKILKAYTVKYDVLNIKAAVQGISSGRQARRIPIGVIHDHGLLDQLFGAENVDDIIELLSKCQLGNYAAILEESKLDQGVKPGFLAEAGLDGEYYQNLLKITENIMDGEILAKVFGIIIDLKNLQVALRAIITGRGPDAAKDIIDGGYVLSGEAVKALLPLKLSDIPGRVEYLYQDMAEEIVSSYDRTKSVTIVGEIIEKCKFQLIKEILSPRVLSPLMIAWFLILKETEIRNLRLTLKAMFDNIPVAEIRNYLVLP